MYDQEILKSFQPGIPSICVGNLSVGGTGKTPLVMYLVALLKSSHKVSILSRGYGRTTKGYILLNAMHSAAAVGDEPLNYFKKFPDVQVAVSEDRVAGYHQLMQAVAKTDVILLDDAFQHRSFSARMNILVTPYHHLYSHDFLLPSGRLRESRSGAQRAQLVIVSKCPDDITVQEQDHIAKQLTLNPGQHLFFTKLQYADLYDFHTKQQLPQAALQLHPVYLFSGIGNDQPLQQFLKLRCQSLVVKTFSDHYTYQSADIAALQDYFQKHPRTIFITTEKDAMRLVAFKDLNELKALPLYILPVNVTFTSEKAQAHFNQIILEYVRQN